MPSPSLGPGPLAPEEAVESSGSRHWGHRSRHSQHAPRPRSRRASRGPGSDLAFAGWVPRLPCNSSPAASRWRWHTSPASTALTPSAQGPGPRTFLQSGVQLPAWWARPSAAGPAQLLPGQPSPTSPHARPAAHTSGGSLPRARPPESRSGWLASDPSETRRPQRPPPAPGTPRASSMVWTPAE